MTDGLQTRQVIVPAADVREAPDDRGTRGKLETQLVYGEAFKIESEANGWYRGFCVHDKYAGYIHASHLSAKSLSSTHIITAARTYAYSGPSMKTMALSPYSFGSKVRITQEDEKFSQLEDGSWLYNRHIANRASTDKDHVDTALKFIETPYYWGGRSGFGIDCSGLVQVALGRAGINVARDTGDQVNTIGKPAEQALRGHFVFFPGHVGIMVDDEYIIHANAHHMKVTVEPLKVVAERGNGITAIRKI
ncbi:MAG: C40 family peptidase [Alphaproteobacteria bacterium]